MWRGVCVLCGKMYPDIVLGGCQEGTSLGTSGEDGEIY